MVMSGSQRSKEDDVQKISTTKAGKRFCFVRFIMVLDIDRLINNLCTVWVGRNKIHANVARFQREPLHKQSNKVNNKGTNNVNHGAKSMTNSYAHVVKGNQVQNVGKEGYANIELKYMGGFWVMIVFQDDKPRKDERVIWVAVEGVPCKWWSRNTFSRIASRWGTLLNGEELEEEVYHGEDGYDVNDGSHEDDMYGGVSENLKDVKGESDREEVPKTNFEEVPDKNTFEGNSVRQTDVHSEDPFDIYEEDEVCVGQHVHERVEVSNDTHESTCSGHFKKSEVHRKGGSILELIDDLVNVGQTMGYDMTGCIKNMEEIIESQGARLHKESLNSRKSILKAELADLDGVIDKEEGSDADGHRRREVVRLIQEVEKVDAMEVAQKLKLNGPLRVTRTRSIIMNDDLKREVSNEEIKRAVWDCGIDKAPRPDSFTFGFYRRYWDIIGNDVVDAVKWFFLHGEIPKGGNSSFITLIPKVPNANMAKDFRPISLIGSLYKVIAKVLANRLVTVLDDIVDEIQSAFTSLSSSLRRMPRSGIESEQWDHLLDSLEGVMLNPSEDRWSWDSKTRWIKEVPIKSQCPCLEGQYQIFRGIKRIEAQRRRELFCCTNDEAGMKTAKLHGEKEVQDREQHAQVEAQKNLEENLHLFSFAFFVCLIKDLYGNQIRELYHSLPYHMIEFVVDDTDCKITVSLRYAPEAYAEIVLNLPDAIDPSSQSKDSSSS
uniref:RNA-directed DNA polymerase, eukaryota, reverse transcriptase zinc-binding domain protein n=1 Tax=Tanacetum cinerariifolium TaxID=118510 RepID=A0A6L2NW39_TANCI|nr:RNA-directed DNA polymerase, eukaryota, reverse transcriptase zinc-binding domain protein [Tanacetum cinerariifolium]